MIRDKSGQVWEVTLDFVSCRRVRNLVGVNLLSMQTARIFSTLADPVTVVEVLYAVCKPQADERKISEVEFLRLFEVDINAATDLLIGKLSDFFRRLGQPTKATQMTIAMERTAKLAAMATTEQMEMITNETFNWMESRIQKITSGEPLTNLPELSESTPTSQD